MIYGNGGEVPIDIVPFGDVEGATPNDAGDADDRAQNYPVFDVSQTGIDPGTGNLEIRYLVDTLPANATYPLDIDFYLAPGPDSQADIWIGSDRYPESSAAAYRTVSIPAPQGIPLVGRVVATSTSGGYFNSTSIQTSELSTQFVVVVPEPSFGMLLAVGLPALGYLRLFRGKRCMRN